MVKKKKKPKRPKKRIASLQDPTLEAIAEGMFRFTSESQAVSLMQRVSGQYRIAKDQEAVQSGQCPTLRLWIGDYAVTKEEEAQGYKGHYARISVVEVADGKYSLTAEKLDIPLAKHLRKQIVNRRHPNNGHPVIRSAQRNKVFAAIEELRVMLLKMHEDFPETTIPGRDKVHAMLYSREYKPPIHKVTVRIVAVPDKGYKFEVSDSVRKEPDKPTATTSDKDPKATSDEQMKDGKFTSMVALQRKKAPQPKPKKPKK